MLSFLFQASSADHQVSVTNEVEYMIILPKVVNMRKLLREINTLDYDYGGPNSRHDPRNGRHRINGVRKP
ncbi:hypothetical protein ZOSMA_29G00110 [Zostera marina]|uniref:Uncharacterized protein n=1 Tax=Zostera marina TaxID=29655 RepID=A0A0K9PB91_ZOSMR|nr:hypothetical protein ZOSMA_29G00110 [Zostera marina]